MRLLSRFLPCLSYPRWRLGALAAILLLVLGIAAGPLLAEPQLHGPLPDFDAAAELDDPVAALPDLRGVPAGPKRKAAFLSMLVPIVEAENARIQAKREWLQALLDRPALPDAEERERLAELCAGYRLDCRGEGVDPRLLTRVDTLPLEMVVIQAVEESGWGTSRFARQGNNLFGMRCFSDGCGLGQQGSGRRFQAFDSIQEAVRAYLHNLNTHRAYERLRARRAELASREDVTPEALIATLDRYAVRADYRDVLLSLLRTNALLIRSHGSDDTA